MSDLSTLTQAEREAMIYLWHRWTQARADEDYDKADALRAELEAWGCSSPDYTTWHPVSEAPGHREKRSADRMTDVIGSKVKLHGTGVVLGPDGKPKGEMLFESEPIPEELAKEFIKEFCYGGNSSDDGSQHDG